VGWEMYTHPRGGSILTGPVRGRRPVVRRSRPWRDPLIREAIRVGEPWPPHPTAASKTRSGKPSSKP